jgi:glycosyltransferase 2 family protein
LIKFIKKKYNLLSVIFSILFIYGLFLIIKDIDLIIDEINQIEIHVFFIASIIYFLSVILRFIRWKIIYLELFGNYRFNILKETIIGYMANNLFPFRLGEFYRVKRITDYEKVNFVKVLSTIFVERFTDVLALLLLLIISLPFVNLKLKYVEINHQTLILYLAVILFLLLLSLFLYLSNINLIKNIRYKIFNIIFSLLEFFLEKRKPYLYLKIFTLSILIWFVEALVYFYIAKQFTLNIDNTNLFFIIIIVCSITNLSGIIPSLPANIGNFEFFGTLTFLVLGIDSLIGASIIITVHLVLFIPITLIGLIMLVTEKFKLYINQ